MPVDVLILRDPRESARKCSLTPLRGLPGITFATYDRDRRLEAGGRILLHPEGELLTPDDPGRGLLLVDCAWRRVDQLLGTVDGELVRRRLPPLETAYPRSSKVFQDPDRGLASVEALYAALLILGDERPELLEGYRWADEFLRLNRDRPFLPSR
jgi:pre-rRNA-processing protein TSR3